MVRCVSRPHWIFREASGTYVAAQLFRLAARLMDAGPVLVLALCLDGNDPVARSSGEVALLIGPTLVFVGLAIGVPFFQY